MFFKGAFLLFLICSPVILAISAEDPLAASEAEIDDEDVVSDEGIVEEAEEKMKDKIVTELVNNEPDPEEAAIVDGVPAASKNVVTEVLFVQPHHTKSGSAASLQIAANKPVNMLVSFTNIETDSQQQNNDYKLDFIEGFLRYPSDYSYYLQNFTARPLDLLVEPKREATIEYSFTPALQLAGRPFGLTLRIGYHNNGGKKFTSTFFNETIQIVELDEGFDTESLFLYLLVVAVAGLAMFGGYHLLSTYALRKLRKAGPSKAVPEQQQPQQHGNIDLEWIPASHLKSRRTLSIVVLGYHIPLSPPVANHVPAQEEEQAQRRQPHQRALTASEGPLLSVTVINTCLRSLDCLLLLVSLYMGIYGYSGY